MPDKRPPIGLEIPLTHGAVFDPSPMTIQMVWREVASLKELIMARLEAIETAIRVAHDDLTRVPTDVMKQVGTLRDLHEEKFVAARRDIAALEAILPEVNRLGTEVAKLEVAMASNKELFTGSRDEAKDAVQHALAAAKEAVAEQNKSSAMAISKSEVAVNKQIESLITLSGTTANAIEGKVADLKDRVTAMESKVAGAKESRVDSRGAGQYAFTIAGFILGALGLVIGWIVSLR